MGLIFFFAILAAIPLVVLPGDPMVSTRARHDHGAAVWVCRLLRRSSDLIQGVWWRTLGIVLVAAIIVRVPLGVLNFLWSSIPVVGVVLSGLVTSIGYAYSGTVLIIYYFDRRCRTRGFRPSPAR